MTGTEVNKAIALEAMRNVYRLDRLHTRYARELSFWDNAVGRLLLPGYLAYLKRRIRVIQNNRRWHIEIYQEAVMRNAHADN